MDYEAWYTARGSSLWGAQGTVLNLRACCAELHPLRSIHILTSDWKEKLNTKPSSYVSNTSSLCHFLLQFIQQNTQITMKEDGGKQLTTKKEYLRPSQRRTVMAVLPHGDRWSCSFNFNSKLSSSTPPEKPLGTPAVSQ